MGVIGKHKKSKGKKLREESYSSSEEENASAVEDAIADLKENDPEFHKYLEENDKNLLDFSASNPLDAVSSEDEDDVEVENAEQQDEVEESTEVVKIDLSVQLVKKWQKQLKDKPTSKLIRNIVTAFKVAVNLNKEENLADYKYSITDEKAFQQLMFLALKELPVAIQKLAPYAEKKGTRILPSNTVVSKISGIMKSHAVSLLVLLDDITNTETAVIVLHSLDKLLPFFLSHRRVLKELMKAVVNVWATTRDIQTQIAAFAFLHKSSKEFKKSILENVLKTTYSTFIKSCRKTNMRTMPQINFQKNSASELFGIDPNLSYQVAFEFIRQLAITLRNSMASTTTRSSKRDSSDAYKLVYNWQFSHSLDFWSRVLSSNFNDNSPLKELIYPLVQVTIGTIRLNMAAQFFPLKFYLIRSLIRLSQNTGTVIPVYPLLSEMMTSTTFTKVPKKKDNLAAFDFDHNIKCNLAYLGTRAYQDGVCQQFVDLLSECMVIYSKNISFPELITPVVIAMRRHIKTTKNIKFNKQLAVVLEKFNQNADYITKQRSQVDFSPSDKDQVTAFLKEVAWEGTPLGAYVVVEREVRNERLRLLRESMEEDDKEQDNKDAAEAEIPSSDENMSE